MDGRLDLGNNDTNFCDQRRAQFRVPVKGEPRRHKIRHCSLYCVRTGIVPFDVILLWLDLLQLLITRHSFITRLSSVSILLIGLVTIHLPMPNVCLFFCVVR